MSIAPDDEAPARDPGRATVAWWRRDRDRLRDVGWPPGVTEVDLWHIDVASTTLFDPDQHEGPRSITEIPDLFAPIDAPTQPINPSIPTPSTRPDGPPEEPDGSIDRLAWYRTFRTNGDWGIFVREQGIEQVAQALTDSPVGAAERQVAATVLHLHEYAHFLFDVAPARWRKRWQRTCTPATAPRSFAAPRGGIPSRRPSATSSPTATCGLTAGSDGCGASSFVHPRATATSLATSTLSPSGKASRSCSVNCCTGQAAVPPLGFAGSSAMGETRRSARGRSPCTSSASPGSGCRPASSSAGVTRSSQRSTPTSVRHPGSSDSKAMATSLLGPSIWAVPGDPSSRRQRPLVCGAHRPPIDHLPVDQ